MISFAPVFFFFRQVANYNDPLPFPDNSLDAAYYVQAPDSSGETGEL